MEPVRFHRPHLTGHEAAEVAAALAGGHLRGDGPFAERASQELRRRTGAAAALLTPSCTHALELAAMLLDLRPGDEVIMPSFTFVSTANAFVLRGATPVFVDIDPHTLGISPAGVRAALSTRTRAVVVVHYAGIAAEMDGLLRLADEHGVALIEDNALGLGGTWKGRPLGSMGSMATLSFHETKNLQCGEGGALLLNDPTLVERAQILREKGTNRDAFLRGDIDRYSWVDIGSSYLLAEVLAAMLCAQMDAADAIQARRHDIWNEYQLRLTPWAAAAGVGLPTPHAHSLHSAHLYHLLLKDPATRDRFLDHLVGRGVGAAFHYVPLHSSPQGRRLGHRGALPVTESVAARLARLPLYPDLADDEVERVIEAVTTFSP
jgi:dTDP-4-amino-4,6-dideoxygalactose transaminase